MSEDLRNSLTQAVPTPPEAAPGGNGPRLVALSGPRQGMVYPLAAAQTTIGRKPVNSIVLPSSGVSKTHCTITGEGERFYLADNESTNGTFANGRQLSPGTRLQLAHGDTLTVFDSTFLFLNPPGQSEVNAPAQLHIDFQAAAREAEALLSQSAEAVRLRRARRQRNTL